MLTNQEKPPDLRVRRTHMLLRKAFMELMSEKDFQSITVQDIADRAMVNRATFYDHFVDKYALLEYSIREGFKQTLHDKVPEQFSFNVEHLQLVILTTCEFLSSLRHHCMPKDLQILPMVQTQITTVISEILLGWIKTAQQVTLDSELPQLMATMTSWAIYGTAFHWSQTSEQRVSQEFIAQSLPAILAILAQVLPLPLG